MHVITPTDLKKFQIEHYSEMLKNPRFEGQEKFLKHEIKRLQNDIPVNRILSNKCSKRMKEEKSRITNYDKYKNEIRNLKP